MKFNFPELQSHNATEILQYDSEDLSDAAATIQPEEALRETDIEPSSEPLPDSQPDSLLDLASQQRNLLLMKPLFELEQFKNSVVDIHGQRTLLTGIDTHYLSLCLMDFLMEGVAIGSGQYPDDVIKFLIHLLQAMAPTLGTSDARKAAEHIANHLTNARDNYKAFSFEYFDAAAHITKSYQFKLISFEADAEENYLFKPTPEGYLVYLGMLDLSPEDSAELMEKMLHLLIQRNKFSQAIDIARRARTLSIEFRQIIKDTISRARRTPRAVDWQNDIQVRLSKARTHVTERRREDGIMMNSVRASLAGTDEYEVRQNIIKLIEVLQSASNIRANLHTEIMQAPDQYLSAQNRIFRVRGPSNLPSLEEILFPSTMALPTETIAGEGDGIVSASYPCKFPHLFDLNTVFTLLLEKRARPERPDADNPLELLIPEIITQMFTSEEINEAESWVAEKLNATTTTSIEEILVRAEEEKLDRQIIMCVTLFLYIAMQDSALLKHIDVVIGEIDFQSKYVRGTSLKFLRRGIDARAHK